jgi:hypothetical protein
MPDEIRQNVFNRRSVQKKANVDSSWGARLSQVRQHTDSNGNLASRFGDSVYGKREKAVVPESPKVLKTRGGMRETEALTSARLAEQARREALKNPQPVYTEPDALDTAAIAQSFVDRHSNSKAADFFYPTPWNNEQLLRAMQYFTAIGKVEWNSVGFDRVHKKLLSEGYYEPVRRLRGMAAPKQFAQEIPVAPAEPQKPALNAYVHDAGEKARLKSLPIDELAKLARATYSKNPYNKKAL